MYFGLKQQLTLKEVGIQRGYMEELFFKNVNTFFFIPQYYTFNFDMKVLFL